MCSLKLDWDLSICWFFCGESMHTKSIFLDHGIWTLFSPWEVIDFDFSKTGRYSMEISPIFKHTLTLVHYFSEHPRDEEVRLMYWQDDMWSKVKLISDRLLHSPILVANTLTGLWNIGSDWLVLPVVGLSCLHYSDVIMIMMASQITSITIVYTTVYWGGGGGGGGADQRKH